MKLWIVTFHTEAGNASVDEYIAKLLCRQNVTLWPTSWWRACAFSLSSSLSLASLPSLSTQGENPRRNLRGRQRSLQSQQKNQQGRLNQERIHLNIFWDLNWYINSNLKTGTKKLQISLMQKLQLFQASKGQPL